MEYLKRRLDLRDILSSKSHFLFGPRGTGKTTLIENDLPGVKIYDLLDSDVFGRLVRRPKTIGEELGTADKLIVIDEIQKLPELLDEVQRLIRLKKVKFLLTGSSARKLKRGSANLLGGRAWQAFLFPLIRNEIPDFELIRYLHYGGLPDVYFSVEPERELDGYLTLYLKEEIQAEAIVRRLEPFVRFLDVIALHNGEEINFENFSSEAGVPARTIDHYIQILEDTLVGFRLPPYLATKKRKAITRSKFFLFDCGVARHLGKIGLFGQGSSEFGRAFEHFIIMEVRAYLSYARKREALSYWRSTSGFEVDCLVGNELAIEVKSTDLVQEKHMKGMTALKEEKIFKHLIVVSRDPRPRVVEGVQILPYQDFLMNLWAGKVC